MDVRKLMLQAAATLGIGLLTVTPALAGNGHGHGNGDDRGTKAGWGLRLGKGWWSGWPKDEGVTTTTTVDAACVKTAIAKRDDAIIAAWDARHTTVRAALQARKTALQTGWNNTDVTARFTALMNAWLAYRTSSGTADDTFDASKKTAWNTFAADRKACGMLTGAEGKLELDARL